MKKLKQKRIKSVQGFGFINNKDKTIANFAMPTSDFKEFIKRAKASEFSRIKYGFNLDWEIIPVKITPIK